MKICLIVTISNKLSSVIVARHLNTCKCISINNKSSFLCPHSILLLTKIIKISQILNNDNSDQFYIKVKEFAKIAKINAETLQDRYMTRLFSILSNTV